MRVFKLYNNHVFAKKYNKMSYLTFTLSKCIIYYLYSYDSMISCRTATFMG